MFRTGIPPNWEPTVTTTTPCSTYSMIPIFIYPSSESCNNPGDLSLQLNCASDLKIHTQRPSIKFQQKPTTICLIIVKHSKHTKLCHHTHCCVDLRGRNSRNKKQNPSTRQIGLTLVINSRAITLKSQMARCPLALRDFRQSNKHNAPNQYRTVE